MGFAELQLRTLFTFEDDGFLLETREPHASRAPILVIVRTKDEVAWAVRRDIPDEIAKLAASESPLVDWDEAPRHAATYGRIGRVESGPAYAFPTDLDPPDGVVRVDEYLPVARRFEADEIAGRSPIYAIIEDDIAVSFCHCARSSKDAAEAGLFTEESHRGRGYGPRVARAWAADIRASGRVPIYSTSWDNAASRSVARKLDLEITAADFSVY